MSTPVPERSSADKLIDRQAQQASELRQLATEIAKQTMLGFDPITIRKGIIQSITPTTDPPTLGVLVSGDETTVVNGVRMMDNFTPLIGATVLVAKQGMDIFALGHILDAAQAATWQDVDLDSGFGHNGNSNGNVQYRKVLDHGSWKMQWRGGLSVSGATNILASALPSIYRPTSRRSVIVARTGSDSNDVKIDFNTNGTATLVGGTTAPSASGGSASVNGFTSLSVDHDHFIGGPHSHSVFVSVAAPTWVSLNNVEYFI